MTAKQNDTCEKLIAYHLAAYGQAVTCTYDPGYRCYIVEAIDGKNHRSYTPQFARLAIEGKLPK